MSKTEIYENEANNKIKLEMETTFEKYNNEILKDIYIDCAYLISDNNNQLACSNNIKQLTVKNMSENIFSPSSKQLDDLESMLDNLISNQEQKINMGKYSIAEDFINKKRSRNNSEHSKNSKILIKSKISKN
jgi:hypothetical protein